MKKGREKRNAPRKALKKDEELVIKGLKEAFIPAILVVVVPTMLLGFLISKGNLLNLLLVALPLMVLVDICANIMNNYSDWEGDIINKKRQAMHAALKRSHLLWMYAGLLLLVAAWLFLSNANQYLWISVALAIVLGLLYSRGPKLKDMPIVNYAAIAVSYAVVALAIGFFSGSSSMALFEKSAPILIFLTLIYFGYSITKDYSDVKGDIAENKRTLPVVFGKDNAIKIQFAAVTLAYIYLVFAVVAGMLQLAFLLLLVTYVIQAYIIYRVKTTDDVKIQTTMHHNTQKNAMLATVLLMAIILLT